MTVLKKELDLNPFLLHEKDSVSVTVLRKELDLNPLFLHEKDSVSETQKGVGHHQGCST